MSVASEIGITFGRELRRNLGSGKGIAAALLYVLGGVGVFLVGVSLNNEIARYGHEVTPEMRRELRRQVLSRLYDDPNTVDHLSSAPELLLGLHTAALFFLPLVVMLIGYDQLAGDLQFRTIRFTTVRSRRETLVLGKALGLWATTSILALALHVIAWTILVVHGDSDPTTVVKFGLHFWLCSAIYSFVYVGLTIAVSSTMKTPILALLTTCVVAFAWWLSRHIVHLATNSAHSAYDVFTPSYWAPSLLSPALGTFMGAASALIAFGAVFLVAACAVIQSRDV
jgi:ABC-type transport system involved in multi-copper enzyme maturation permease subunit